MPVQARQVNAVDLAVLVHQRTHHRPNPAAHIQHRSGTETAHQGHQVVQHLGCVVLVLGCGVLPGCGVGRLVGIDIAQALITTDRLPDPRKVQYCGCSRSMTCGHDVSLTNRFKRQHLAFAAVRARIAEVTALRRPPEQLAM